MLILTTFTFTSVVVRHAYTRCLLDRPLFCSCLPHAVKEEQTPSVKLRFPILLNATNITRELCQQFQRIIQLSVMSAT